MSYCRECGTEITLSQSFCKKCGIKTNTEVDGEHLDPQYQEEALSAIEALKVLYRYYTYPENRKYLTFHLALAIVTAGAWAGWFIFVWFSIWDGTTSKDIGKFTD